MEPMVVIAARTAEKVGKEILYAHENRHKIELDIESKGLDGLVTRIDRFSEELTIETLKASYPNHSFLGEEFGMQEGRGEEADWCWIIDPLDGTKTSFTVSRSSVYLLRYSIKASLNTAWSMILFVTRCSLPAAVKGRA